MRVICETVDDLVCSDSDLQRRINLMIAWAESGPEAARVINVIPLVRLRRPQGSDIITVVLVTTDGPGEGP